MTISSILFIQERDKPVLQVDLTNCHTVSKKKEIMLCKHKKLLNLCKQSNQNKLCKHFKHCLNKEKV